MGGNAFAARVPDATFPRMPPPVYDALKAALLPIVQTLYMHVAVPREAPEKADFGDLDFVVSGPREGLTHDEVAGALRAALSVPMEGNRTSNFAIPLDAFPDVARAWRESDLRPLAEEGAHVFVQVDVNVCADKAQMDRTVFCHSYGDLSLMLGLLAQTAGLSLGIYGLKLVTPVGSPPQTFFLTDSMHAVLAFLGLSMERWESGFVTQDELFHWVASSPFAAPLAERLKASDMPTARERVEARPVRQRFVEFMRTHAFPESSEDEQPPASVFATIGRRDEKIAAALQHFGREREHAGLLYRGRAAAYAKAVLNGTNIQEWTGVTGVPVRVVLDEVKARLAAAYDAAADNMAGAAADVPAWQRVLLGMEEDEVRVLVVAAKEELDAAGKLTHDWRAAKAARMDRKKQRELGAAMMQVNEQAVTE
ncbi:hypothetical protein BD413DRAFT_614023 [Trametes elegans]|nr:hypothetical protein BD413DRAFT_614023 [Trametes elegans]